MKLTRRQLASMLTAASALAQGSSQTPAQPSTPEALLQAARDEVQANAARLASQAVPMNVEPAFEFKA